MLLSLGCARCHKAVSSAFCPDCGERQLDFHALTLRGLAGQLFAATLAGCARFYENQEAAFQQRLPQLVADCNEVFRSSDRPASWNDGIKACKQLWDRQGQ